MSNIIVYGVPGSPYVRIALLGLEEKGAPYRLAAMGIGENKAAAHLARQPFGRIPAIEHDGFVLYESQAILRYLDDVFEQPQLTPTEPQAKARMNQVMGIVDWYVFPSITSGIGWNRVVAPKFGIPVDEAAVAAALPNAKVCIEVLEGLLGSQRYMAGDAISLADLMLVAHLDFFPDSPEGAGMLRGSPLMKWLERMRERPSLQATTWDRLLQAA